MPTRFVEVRPEGLRNVELRIGALPEEEVGEPLLPAGPDDELRVRDACGVQVAREQPLRQLLRLPLPLRAVGGEAPGRPQDLVPAAVVQADVCLEAILGQMLRDLVGLIGQGPELRGDGRHVPEEVEPDMVPLHAVHCLQQVLLEKRHDGGDLRLRALPVLRGEGVDREVLDADVLAVRCDAAEGLGSHLVSRGAGQAPLGGPAAVAIHDNGNVTGRSQLLCFRFYFLFCLKQRQCAHLFLNFSKRYKKLKIKKALKREDARQRAAWQL